MYEDLVCVCVILFSMYVSCVSYIIPRAWSYNRGPLSVSICASEAPLGKFLVPHQEGLLQFN